MYLSNTFINMINGKYYFEAIKIKITDYTNLTDMLKQILLLASEEYAMTLLFSLV